MGIFSKPKAPKNELNQAQKALEIRQASLLDEEVEEQQARLKAMARGRLGYKSLLSGIGGSNAPTSRFGSRTSLIGGGYGGGSGGRTVSGGGGTIAPKPIGGTTSK